MKSEFLKIAGVKTDKAFYAKYPSETAFFKAHPEAKKLIKKAQVGIQVDNNNNGVPDYLESIQPIQGPQNQMPQLQAIGSNLKPAGVNSQIPLPSADLTTAAADLTKQTPPSPSLASKAMPFVGAATDIIKGITALKGQKEEKQRMRQARKVTDIQKIASGTRQEDPERRYVRPEDMIIQPNQMFPTYGVGSNVLTRNGGSIKRAEYGKQIFGNPTEIQNTYAPEYDIYDDGGYEPLNDSNKVKQYYYGGGIPRAQDGGGFMNFMETQGGGETLGMLTGALSNNSGESQIGKGIGTAAGTAFFGPVGGMIGGALGGAVGGLFNTSQKAIENDRRAVQRNQDAIMGNQFGQSFQNQYSSVVRNGGNVPNYEEGGQLTNPRLITKFGELDQQDFYDYAHEGMPSFRAGGHLRSYTPPTNRAMQTYAMGGELETHWGGEAETMSYNPYLPGQGETVMFRGQSHDESDGRGNTGIGITYGDSPVEVERGEPAVKLKDGSSGEENLTVYGNLKIPNEYISLLGDDKAKGKKFKNYIAEISKDEAKQNKLIEKSTNLLNSLDVKNSFDKLKFDALTANINGANMKLKSIADKKINAASLQNAINDTAEEYGLVADDLARGKGKIDKEAMKEYAEYGKSIPKAQVGYKTKGKGDKWSFTQAGETGNPLFDDMQRYETEWTPEVTKALSDKERSEKMLKYIENYSGEGSTNIKKALNKIPTKEGKIMFLQQQATNKEVGPIHYVVDAAIKFTSPQMTTPLKEEVKETTKEVDKTYQTTPYKRSVLMDVANQILPFIRPTDQEPLDPNQLMGEMYALSSNQLEPVQAQSFQPDLGTPYDISLQDQLNANQADFNAVQRMVGYNPAALSALAAQKYAANTGVLGEQFRQNQAMRAGVFDKNRDILNDAKLKNLAIFDQQYGRQEQAKSNTKAITQAALSSIGDKYAKNRLENRELGIMENMYNYRYDPSGRAINMNPLYQPNMPTVYSKQSNPNMVPVKDADGNIIEYRSITPSSTSMATPTYVQSTSPTVYTSNEDYAPIKETQEDIYNEVAPKRKGGTIKKKYFQSSIVKAYKNL